MAYMFYINTQFNNNGNPSISGWNVSNVTTTGMTGMFYSASSFNQDISYWTPSNVTSLALFMTGKTSSNYDSSKYDNLLNSWSTKALKTGVTANFGQINFTSSGAAGKAILTGVTSGWTITDGGQI
jgi:hypothetical protein